MINNIQKIKAPVYVQIRTYGCQMNVLDSQIISGLLTEHGYVIVDSEEKADAIIFNTCSVRDLSERKVLGKLGTLTHKRKQRPELVLGVCGCMAELSGERIIKKNPHVDFVCGTHERQLIPENLTKAFRKRITAAEITKHNAEHLERLQLAFQDCKLKNSIKIENQKSKPDFLDERVALRPNFWNAFVEIMRGCSNFCSYCVVPYARGIEVSRTSDDIIDEITELAANGCVEVTLLGQNVNSYGLDLSKNKISFAQLLRKINKIEGIKWIRFVTSNPHDITDELIAAISECEKVCHQIHFPLQSGSDRILKLMRRKYTRAEYMEKVKKIRIAVPDMAFSGDFILGFPTETEEDFQDTFSAIKKVNYASSFIFKYSVRSGTAAAKMDDDVTNELKKERHKKILDLQNSLTHNLYKKQIGTNVEVLVEGQSKRNPKMGQGRTSQYFNVVFPNNKMKGGDFVKVKIIRATKLTLYGEKI